MRFIKTIQKAGLYANLRIGPYVCAEWNFGYSLLTYDLHLFLSLLIFLALLNETLDFAPTFSLVLIYNASCRGFPVWLKYVPGISFRTDNEPFKVFAYARLFNRYAKS